MSASIKNLIFIFTLATTVGAVKAQAVVKPDGAFVPAECGIQGSAASAKKISTTATLNSAESGSASVAAIEEICVGRISGSGDSAVQFRFENGDSELLRVASTSNLLVALKTRDIKSMFYLVGQDGQRATMKVIQTRDGFIKSVAGELKTATYFVPEMQQVYTIQ
jgi:hypothetical protein